MKRSVCMLVLASLTCMCAVFSTVSSAAVVTVVLSADSAACHEAADAIEASLGKEHTLIKVLLSKLSISDSALSRAGLLMAVGVDAANAIAGRGGRAPVLAVLVPEAWYRREGQSRLAVGHRDAGAVLREQPMARQFRLIRLAFPEARKVGVVLGPGNAGAQKDLKRLASSQNLALISQVAESEADLFAALRRVLTEADLLLAIPDALVLSRHMVQSVLKTAYRHRDPVVAYSKAMSSAGALLTLYSTPAQIGRQAGETANRVLAGGSLSGVHWPKYFTVSVNGHVARTMGNTALDEAALTSRLAKTDD